MPNSLVWQIDPGYSHLVPFSLAQAFGPVPQRVNFLVGWAGEPARKQPDTTTLPLSPTYAKLKLKASVNFTQTSTRIYELFHRPFGNHAVHISANLSSPDDF